MSTVPEKETVYVCIYDKKNVLLENKENVVMRGVFYCDDNNMLKNR